MRRTVVIALVLQTAAAATSLAQQAANSPYPGSMLRITLAGQESVIGTLFRSDLESIVVRDDGDTVRVLWEDVQRLEISRGARRHGKALLIGAGIGGATGLLGGVVATVVCGSINMGGDRHAAQDWCGEQKYTVYGLLGGLAVGTMIGAAIQFVPTKRTWEEVSLDRLRMSIVPTASGLGFTASIAF